MYCIACNEELNDVDLFDDEDEEMCLDCINSNRDLASEEDSLRTEDRLSFSEMEDLGVGL